MDHSFHAANDINYRDEIAEKFARKILDVTFMTAWKFNHLTVSLLIVCLVVGSFFCSASQSLDVYKRLGLMMMNITLKKCHISFSHLFCVFLTNRHLVSHWKFPSAEVMQSERFLNDTLTNRMKLKILCSTIFSVLNIFREKRDTVCLYKWNQIHAVQG